MTLSLHERVAIAACNAIVDQADLGTTNAAASFSIYSGPVPASVKAPLSGNTVLVQMTMSNPAFGDAVDNDTDGFAEAEAAAIGEVAAVADGTATFYRLFDRDGIAIWQGNITAPNLGGDMELSSVDVIEGVNVVVQSFFIRMPK